LERESNPRQPI